VSLGQDAPDYTLLSDVNVVGSVTIDVNVVGAVTLNVYVTNSELNAYITNTVLNVNANITNSTLNVNVTNTTLNVNANITNTSLNVNATIVQSQVTLNVNVTNTSINVNITNATLNVNITNQVVQTGIPKTCLALDGYDDRIVVPRSSSIEPSTITIIAKIYVTSRKTYDARIVDKDSSTGGYLLMIKGDPDNRIVFQIRDSSGGLSTVYSASSVPLNTWLTVAAVYDGTTLYIYINGELSNSLATTRVLAPGTANLYIGNNPGLARGLPGYFSHLLIYNRALTADEIKHMVDNVYSPIPSGLVLWLKMDEGSGTTVYDSSGYNNNGTIYGATWVSSAGSAPTAINVNITASQVTFNVNVTNSSLNVNATIVQSQVTFNVNVQTQAVDLKIYTPSGRWVSASDLLTGFVDSGAVGVSPNSETTLISVTGKRGRLKYLGLRFYDTGTAFSLQTDLKLRIYIDGSLKVECSMERLDGFVGGVVERLRAALGHALASGLSLPFNTARIGQNPDQYIVMPFHNSPYGCVTFGTWDQTNGKWRMFGAYLAPEIEFTNSLTIAVYNANTSATGAAYAVAFIGEYL
jgi:hypothetical protein